MGEYVPERGDYVILTFDPQSGREQKGRRPALVISNYLFNKHTGLSVACPITNTDRGFPFHVPVDADSELTGFIMVEQVKSIDYRARKLTFAGKCSRETLDEVLAILDASVYQGG